MISISALPLRILHLIRHGQYQTLPPEPGGPNEGELTEFGRLQATLAGRYLKQWPIQSILSSDLPRARQTAELISSELDGLEICSDAGLRELLPSPPPGMPADADAQARVQARLQAILDNHFQPSESEVHQAIVAHGNLIRAVVCTALGLDVGLWLKLHIYHTSMTRLLVYPDGEVKLACFNEIGYLPPNLWSEQ